jgi:hypothetical protein
MVTDLKTLFGYAYCGHSRIMGKKNSDWQDVDKVLELFAFCLQTRLGLRYFAEVQKMDEFENMLNLLKRLEPARGFEPRTC